jgi:hypothetical protein
VLVLHVAAGQFIEKALHARWLTASKGSGRQWEEGRKGTILEVVWAEKNVTCVLGVGVDIGVAWGVIIHIVCTHVRRVVSR